ncbi:hypothetical protein LX99_00643 [Mucilaginibacter oryzae]|uniref:Uncharacterized protein n=1 Tax=Mucilaginibacter oryzae TaxID=468058 RepID=A0A316HG24_9SPHI|nr:hypothetical protein [Mucilaginibacter oryzae]PWK80179.1 hypothetical protein LX99_00643 [Mucilaginibacter oryzae]
MSTQIKIASPGDDAKLVFEFQTTDLFFYEFEVVDCDSGNQFETGKGQWDGETEFNLGRGSDLVGKCLNIAWGEIDPAGGTGIFRATATVKQNGISCAAVQVFTGNSTATIVNDTTEAVFI